MLRRFLAWLLQPTTTQLSGRGSAWLGLGAAGFLIYGRVPQKYEPNLHLEGPAHIVGAAFGVVLLAAVYLAWLEFTTLSERDPTFFD